MMMMLNNEISWFLGLQCLNMSSQKISRAVIGLIRKIHTNRRKPGVFTPFFIAMIVLTETSLLLAEFQFQFRF